MGHWGWGRSWRARFRGGPQRLLGRNSRCRFQGEHSRSGKWVKDEKERLIAPPLPPPRQAEARGVGVCGQERALRARLCLSLPSPAALLSLCTSAGNVPLTYIFFQTYVTFFFFSLCGRRRARIQEKEKLERCAREKTGRLSPRLPQQTPRETDAHK